MNYLKITAPLVVLLITSACVSTSQQPHVAADYQSLQWATHGFLASNAEQGFGAARAAYRSGDAITTLVLARRVMDLYPNTPSYKRALFLTEQALMRLDHTSEAAAAMLRIQYEYPELADYAVFLMADYHFSNSRYSEAAALYEEVIDKYPRSALVTHAAFNRAQALLESNAYPQAAEAFVSFLKDNPRSEFAPAAGLGLGKALTAEAVLAQAVRAYQDVWIQYPGQPNDHEVEKALTNLEAGGVTIPELTAEELYIRGSNLFQSRLYDGAVTTFTAYLKKSQKSPDRSNALYYTGISLYYLGKRGEAAGILETMIRDYPTDEKMADALYWLGKSYSKLGDWDNGVKTFDKLIETFPDSEWCDDALYMTGNIFRESNDMPKALRSYDKLVKEYSDSKYADSAIWWRAWWNFTSGDYAKAASTFQELIDRYPRSFLVNQALYWKGRSTEKLGELSLAESYYDRLLKKGPYTYYGYRAAERKAILEAANVVKSDTPAETTTPCTDTNCTDEMQYAVDLDEGPLLWTADMNQLLSKDERLRKILELVLLDMKKEAASELWALKDTMPRRRQALLELSKVFFELGDYYHSLIIVLRMYEHYLEGPVQGVPDDLWFLAYPQGYWESIMTYARKYKQDPYFIAAIIKEESQFRPEALSSAGARGLMQVMPATGGQIARTNGIPAYDQEKLFDADMAINIGTWYVSQLMKRFGNDPLLVAAAYNAGPDAVQGWLTKNGYLAERDFFVELIPYSETRAYVKKVLRNYAEYKRLYDKTTGISDLSLQRTE